MDHRLFKAATQGNVQALKELVEKEPKLINSVTPQENTLLHIAARLGNTEFAEELLRRSGAFLILKNAEEDTALHIAAKAGRLDMVVLFIHHAMAWSTDIERDEEGPLRLTNKLQNTALHEAVKNGYSRIAVRLLHAEPTASHMLNARKETPLHIAAREGLIQVVFEILQYPWVPPQEEEELQPFGTGSPLHQAVLGGHRYMLELLLTERPDFINVIDIEGNTALHYAARTNGSKMVEMLLMHEPSLAYHKNDDGYSSLHVAAARGSTSSIKELLKQCPDAAEQMKYSQGWNALHIAVVYRRVAALKCLLKIIQFEEIINQADRMGNTPLHLAAQEKGIYLTKVLLDDKRVNPFIVNEVELTPRGVAESSGEMDIYKILLSQQLKKREDRIGQKHPELTAFGANRISFPKMYSAASEEQFKSSAETYTLVAALIATVTFAAFFTMPGGYDNTSGYPQLESQAAFKAFLISNTIAMCSSLIVVFCFIWAWNDPVRFQAYQMTWGHGSSSSHLWRCSWR